MPRHRNARGQFVKGGGSRALVRRSSVRTEVVRGDRYYPRNEQVVVVDERGGGRAVSRRGGGRRRAKEGGIIRGTVGALLGGASSGIIGAILTGRGWSIGATALAVGVFGGLVAWFGRRYNIVRTAGIVALGNGVGALLLGSGDQAQLAAGQREPETFWGWLLKQWIQKFMQFAPFSRTSGPAGGGGGPTPAGPTGVSPDATQPQQGA